jgi:fumarylacetoacetase
MVESGALKSWISYDENSHFPLENIPFGVFTNPKYKGSKQCCTRIGDKVIDLATLAFDGKVFTGPILSK